MNYPKQNRYRLFREHKYIFYTFSKVLHNLAIVDFNDLDSVTNCRDEAKKLLSFLNAHTIYEEEIVSKALTGKGSLLFQTATAQHIEQAQNFTEIFKKFEYILSSEDSKERFDQGYKLYLDLRDIFAYVLKHLEYEERIIIPEMQRLLTDDEIKEIDNSSYKLMSSEQLLNVIQSFVPCLNFEDRIIVLTNIQSSDPIKFLTIWNDIKLLLSKKEIYMIEEKLSINMNQEECVKKNETMYWERSCSNGLSHNES